MNDLRETSVSVIAALAEMRSLYPPRSPGRRALQDALDRVRMAYLFGDAQKRQLIMSQIADGNSSFADLCYIGISRPELEDLLADLIEAGYLRETQKRPISSNGAGRPVRVFEIIIE